MSNPGVMLLAEGKIKNKTVRIEDNLGESIHIHIDDIRLSLTVKEFYKLFEAVNSAARELFELEGLPWEVIDQSSLDWMWLSDYEDIDGFEKTEVALGDIYTLRYFDNNGSIYKIVKLKDSALVEELNNRVAESQTTHFSSSGERLLNIKSLIESRGYPFDDKLIMLDDNNRMYDGDHRAACLYYLYGDDHRIPVLRIRMKNKKEIKTVLSENRRTILKYRLKKLNKKLRAVPKMAVRKIKKILNSKGVPATGRQISFADVIETIKRKNLRYCVFDYKMIVDNQEIVKTIFVDDIEKIRELQNVSMPGIYSGYTFLYSVPCPIEIKTEEGKILIWDHMCCKSRFEKAILPLDKKINNLMWKTCDNDKDGKTKSGNLPQLIYVIAHCVVEKGRFDREDVDFVKQNRELLMEEEFADLAERVFFSYTGKLIGHLQREEYIECVRNYLTNKDY